MTIILESYELHLVKELLPLCVDRDAILVRCSQSQLNAHLRTLRRRKAFAYQLPVQILGPHKKATGPDYFPA